MISPAMPPCPQCGQSDAVQPISTIFAGAAPAVGTAPNAAPPVSAFPPVAPEIAQRLFPPSVPAEPKKLDFSAAKYLQPSPETKNSPWRWIDSALIVVWLVLLVVVFLKINDEDINDIFALPIALVLIFVIYGFRQLVIRNLPLPGLREYYQRDAAEDAAAEQRATEAYNAALAEHQRLAAPAARWQNLLYCARDNGVFDPQERRFIPTDAVQDYLKG